MYFNVYTFNATQQGQYLLRDLKLAQQVKLSPKCTYTTQILGCIFRALLNYLMMQSIVRNQEPILLSIEGSPIWSGINIQSLNSAAITWSMASKMFSIGQRYQWVSIAYLVCTLSCYLLLSVFFETFYLLNFSNIDMKQC